jgi:hypothetical protein
VTLDRIIRIVESSTTPLRYHVVTAGPELNSTPLSTPRERDISIANFRMARNAGAIRKGSILPNPDRASPRFFRVAKYAEALLRAAD